MLVALIRKMCACKCISVACVAITEPNAKKFLTIHVTNVTLF